jgi:hypothetical protein
MKRNKIAQVRALLEANPLIKTEAVMKTLGTAKSYTYVLMSKARSAYAQEHGHTINSKMSDMRRLARRIEVARSIEAPPVAVDISSPADTVDHPAHYKVGGIETIDFIEAKKLGYNLGNVVKYITRADHKGNKLEDLRKAQWYLTREIATLK